MIEKNLLKEDYAKFIFHQATTGGIDLWGSLVNQGVMEWPSKETFLSMLSKLPSSEFFSDYNYAPHKNKTQAYAFAIERLGITIAEIHNIDPLLFNYLRKQEDQTAVVNAIKNASPDEVRYWLEQQIGITSLGSGQGKSGVVGFLVSSGYDAILDEVSKKLPNWGGILDSRGRSPLFYASSEMQLSQIVKAGADPMKNDSSGKKLAQWWATTHSPEVVTRMYSELQRLGIEGSPSMTDSMVTKLFKLGADTFSKEELVEFDKARSDPNWSWNGSLEGVKRSWTLEEIWRFGEVAAMSGKITPATPMMKQLFNYSSLDGSRNEINKFATMLSTIRSQLPLDLRDSWFESGAAKEKNPFTRMLVFLSMAPDMETLKKNEKISSIFKGSLNSSYLAKQHVGSIYEFWAERELSLLSREERLKIVQAIPEFNNARWIFSGPMSNVIGVMMFGNPGNKETVLYSMSDDLCRLVQEAPQKSSLFSPQVMDCAYEVLRLRANAGNINTINSTQFCAMIKYFSMTSDNASSKCLANKKRLMEVASLMLGDMDLNGQPISPRWLKGLDEKLRSAISLHLLQNTATKVRAQNTDQNDQKKVSFKM